MNDLFTGKPEKDGPERPHEKPGAAQPSQSGKQGSGSQRRFPITRNSIRNRLIKSR